MLIVYGLCLIALITLLCKVIKSDFKYIIKYYLFGLFIIFGVAIHCTVNSGSATNNIYIGKFSIDFLMLILFFIMVVMVPLFIELINGLKMTKGEIKNIKKEDLHWKSTLLVSFIVIIIVILVRLFVHKLIYEYEIIKKTMFIGFSMIVVPILIVEICQKWNTKRKNKKSKRICKKLSRVINHVVRDVNCIHCKRTIKNTMFQCVYCGKNQVDLIKAVVFNKEEILLLCKKIRQSGLCDFEVEMEQVLKNIKAQGLKIVVIGTAMSWIDVNIIEKSPINEYIDKKFFTKRKSSVEEDKKIFRKIISDMHLDEKEILFVGSYIDTKIFVARELGIYSIHYLLITLLKINAYDYVKLYDIRMMSEAKDVAELEKLILNK